MAYWIGAYANNTGSVWENGPFHVRRGQEWFWENHQKIGLFRPLVDGKPDNDMDTESDFAIAICGAGTMYHLGC